LMSLLAVEETDVTDAEPTELMSLFLTDDFWTLKYLGLTHKIHSQTVSEWQLSAPCGHAVIAGTPGFLGFVFFP